MFPLRRAASAALVVLLLTTAPVLLSACSGSHEAAQERAFRREFRSAYKRYQRYEPVKSLALARDADGHWAYGYARGVDKEIKAVNEAIANCKRRRARYGVKSRCRTYAVGSEIIGGPALVAEPLAQPE